MQVHTVYAGSPDDIAAIVSKALAPICSQVDEIHKRAHSLPSLLSVARIADDCSCSRETVRKWIVDGRKLSGRDKIIRLKVVGGLTDGRHLIRREDYEDFLDQFPSVRA